MLMRTRFLSVHLSHEVMASSFLVGHLRGWKNPNSQVELGRVL